MILFCLDCSDEWEVVEDLGGVVFGVCVGCGCCCWLGLGFVDVWGVECCVGCWFCVVVLGELVGVYLGLVVVGLG